jgi:NRAMP (natural resistance-associated macrophage protein)-like metal ion transporter
MAAQPLPPLDRRRHDPEQHERLKNGQAKPVPHGVFRSLGLGLITGAADDDPSAIGTYAAAGAAMGPSFLWVAPFAFPMMFTVVYLCSKVGQVTGRGLFAVIRRHYPRWLLYWLLIAVLIGNVVEAGADLGGMAAALNVIAPVNMKLMVVGITAVVLALQIWGSYQLIRKVFRFLALALLAYVAAAFLAKPELLPVIKGTVLPRIHFNRDFLTMVVAVMGTSLSAYLYSWQSNQDVEEDISMGRRRLVDRIGTSKKELHHSARDIGFGMFFASLIMYFIILSTAATLFQAGEHNINTAAQAAEALRPFAGGAAGILFAAGVVGVGFLAVPVMTTGAAFDLCQTLGWKHGLHYPPAQAKKFNVTIAVLTVIAMCLNFFGVNPMKALVWAGIVQGFSTPFLMLLVLRITSNGKIMGRWTNTRALNLLGWLTFAAMSCAAIGLVVAWLW